MARTTSWQLIAVYAVILLAVILARKEFYREKFVYSWGALTVDSILFGRLFIGYAVAWLLRRTTSWWQSSYQSLFVVSVR